MRGESAPYHQYSIYALLRWGDASRVDAGKIPGPGVPRRVSAQNLNISYNSCISNIGPVKNDASYYNNVDYWILLGRSDTR
jgi:hypothetical protein